MAKEASYLENEGCPDDVVHPKRHCRQRILIKSICLGSVYDIMTSVVGVAGGRRDLHVAARRLGGGKFGDDVGDYVISRRPLTSRLHVHLLPAPTDHKLSMAAFKIDRLLCLFFGPEFLNGPTGKWLRRIIPYIPA